MYLKDFEVTRWFILNTHSDSSSVAQLPGAGNKQNESTSGWICSVGAFSGRHIKVCWTRYRIVSEHLSIHTVARSACPRAFRVNQHEARNPTEVRALQLCGAAHQP
jgi:hypothetical protein